MQKQTKYEQPYSQWATVLHIALTTVLPPVHINMAR